MAQVINAYRMVAAASISLIALGCASRNAKYISHDDSYWDRIYSYGQMLSAMHAEKTVSSEQNGANILSSKRQLGISQIVLDSIIYQPNPSQERAAIVVPSKYPGKAPKILPGSQSVYYQQIGNTTFSSDGEYYQQIGNATFGSDGSIYQYIGNTTFGDDGTYYQQIGDTTFGSDGNYYQQVGNMVFGSNGSMCQTIGTMVFCD